MVNTTAVIDVTLKLVHPFALIKKYRFFIWNRNTSAAYIIRVNNNTVEVLRQGLLPRLVQLYFEQLLRYLIYKQHAARLKTKQLREYVRYPLHNRYVLTFTKQILKRVQYVNSPVLTNINFLPYQQVSVHLTQNLAELLHRQRVSSYKVTIVLLWLRNLHE